MIRGITINIKEIQANAIAIFTMYGFVTAKISEGKTVKESIKEYVSTFNYEGNELSLTRIYYSVNKETRKARKGE